MSASPRPWRLREAPRNTIDNLADQLDISALLARLLVVRGITDTQEAGVFLDEKGGDVHDPFEFSEIEKAVERVLSAIDRGERVLVHGDYDVDGLTGTAILVETLRDLGLDVDYHIPHRIHDGYGLRAESVREIGGKFPLMITVDCGTSSYEALDVASESGLEVIVTDHHDPGEKRPTCVAILNPHRQDEEYPWPHLSGSAVAWKLALALRDASGQLTTPEKNGLDLAGLGTVADAVPLLGENRALVKRALPILREHTRPGIKALLDVSGSRAATLDTETIGYKLSPRLNALGRLSDSFDAVELLLTHDEARAKEIASTMDDLNRKRQALEKEVSEQSLSRIEKEGLTDGDAPLVCVAGENWHQGVLGIVASRLVDRFHRPAIVMTVREGEVHGSGRSVEGRSLVAVLDRVRDLLVSGGGHQMAIGLGASAENLGALREALVEAARQEWAQTAELMPLWIDADIPPEQVSLNLIDGLRPLGPHGTDNPEALFRTRARVSGYGGQIVGNNHLRFSLEHSRGLLGAIAFKQGHKLNRLAGGEVDVAFHVQSNEYQGRIRPQILVRDVRPAETDALSIQTPESNDRAVYERSATGPTKAPPQTQTAKRRRPTPTATPPSKERFRCRITREDVGQVWRMVKKMQTERGVDVEILAGLLRTRGVDPERTRASVQVLEELALVGRTGKMVQLQPTEAKLELTDSPTYRELSRSA